MFKSNPDPDPKKRQPPKKPGHAAPPAADGGAIVPHSPPPTNRASNQSSPPKTHFERFMEVLDDRSRLQLLEGVRLYGLDTKDPYFVLMLAQTLISTALLEAPGKIQAAIVEAVAAGNVVIDRKTHSVIESTTKKIEWEIAKGINTMLGRHEMAGLSAISIPLLSIAAVALVGFGAAAGWALTQLQRSPIVPGKVSLSAQQVEDLRWLETPEAKLARNLVKWNEGQITACQKNQLALFDEGQVVVAGYGKVKSGACVLWVVPPDVRRFEPK